MQNLMDPAILFFIFGVMAGMVKSNLEIPPQISRFLSLYLLMALGLKGGFAIAHSGFTLEVASSLLCAILLAIVVPIIAYNLLKNRLSRFNAAAIAATYGSVSAVTFITATQFLDTHQIAYGGHMAAAMALMESPAIIMAVLMANMLRQQVQTASVSFSGSVGLAGTASFAGTTAINAGPAGIPFRKVLHESFTDGAQLLLLGAMVIGLLTGEAGKAVMQPFSGDLFKGMLAFFLLDMGLLAARSFPKKGEAPAVLVVYALLSPLLHAAIAYALATLMGISAGNTALLMVLAASASYIAVPAVIRHAIPEANPSLYFGMSLGITFPFNIIVGIPLYVTIATSQAL